MKTCEVYKITNTINNKIYIGITNQGSGARFRHHLYEARIGEPAPIHKAMAKYGEKAFKLEIIDFADDYETLKEKEKYYIKLYDSRNRTIGYNLTEGGDGTFGKKHSKETKEKIRQKALGRIVSEETKNKMSETHKKNYSDNHRKAVSESNKKRVKPVLMYDLNMNFIKEFKSLKEAAAETKIHSTTIRKSAKGTKISYECIFRYKEAA